MPKQSGLGDNFYLGGYDLSGDVSALTAIRMPSVLLDVTAINKSAHERLLGLADGELSFNTWFNDAASQEHVALKGLPRTDVQALYFRGTTLGNPAAGLLAKQVNYDATRGADGSLAFAVQCLGQGQPLEWCQSGTAGKRTDTGATNGASIDLGTGSLSFGLAAYLQVFAFTGTSVTVAIQESSDDGGLDPFAAVTGGALAAVSGANVVERIQTSLTQTVERYLRVVTTGTFTNAVFAVAIIRYGAVNQGL